MISPQGFVDFLETLPARAIFENELSEREAGLASKAVAAGFVTYTRDGWSDTGIYALKAQRQPDVIKPKLTPPWDQAKQLQRPQADDRPVIVSEREKPGVHVGAADNGPVRIAARSPINTSLRGRQ